MNPSLLSKVVQETALIINPTGYYLGKFEIKKQQCLTLKRKRELFLYITGKSQGRADSRCGLARVSPITGSSSVSPWADPLPRRVDIVSTGFTHSVGLNFLLWIFFFLCLPSYQDEVVKVRTESKLDFNLEKSRVKELVCSLI